MKKNIGALLLMTIFVTPAVAEKPEWAGKGKPTTEQKAAHKAAMQAKEELGAKEKKLKEEKNKPEKLKAAEKQRAKKSEQVQKELDKGSDKGKESRQSHSKKWWKFWE